MNDLFLFDYKKPILECLRRVVKCKGVWVEYKEKTKKVLTSKK